MDTNLIKEKIIATANEGSLWMKNIEAEIYKNPELGFKEHKTSALVQKAFSELGIEYETSLAITGVKAKLKGRNSKFNLCIIGELDAVISPEHPNALPNGVVHACGHSAQIATMLGVAYILKKSGVMEYLDGDVTFMAVPAEEFIELDYRAELKNQGKIKYFSGKQQLIYEGAFDDVDMAVMIHALSNQPDPTLHIKSSSLGFTSKKVIFKGKASHAAAPADGTNALNAAALAIIGIHSNRDTFREEERIRIHPIITKGGDVVNTVPDGVEMEMQVRGATPEAVDKASTVTNRSVLGAAQIIGAEVEINDIIGYLPLEENLGMVDVMEEVAKDFIGAENIKKDCAFAGSTDMGDVSAIMPAIHPTIGGFNGGLHSKNFKIANEDIAILLPAKLMAAMAVKLLINGGEKAEAIKNNFVPHFTKEQYLKRLEGDV